MKIFEDNRGAITESVLHLLPIVASNTTSKADILAFMEVGYGHVDKANESIDKRITCKKGCSFCCHDDIKMTSFEADYLLDHIKKKGIKHNRSLVKVQNRAKDFSKLKFNKKKCPLLGEEGECTVYEARPMICRIYNSTSLDTMLCHPSTSGESETVKIVEVMGFMGALIKTDNKPSVSIREILE